jgi:hypothetical protein
MIEIIRLTKPTNAQFIEAIQFAERLQEHFKTLRHHARFAAFQRLGIELVLVKENKQIQALCFVLPDKYYYDGEERRFVWLFDMIADPKAKNLGSFMLFRIMNWYPSTMCIGVTKAAARLYQALRWNKYDKIWRCVRPVKLMGMFERYQSRLEASWKSLLLKMIAPCYDALMSFVEAYISSHLSINQGTPFSRKKGKLQRDNEFKLNIVSSYLDILTIDEEDQSLEAVIIHGIARIVYNDFHGFKRFLAYLRLQQIVRKKNVLLLEYLTTCSENKRKAFLYGFIPIRMPIYYWDKHNRLDEFFKKLDDDNFAFASCDKIL